MTIAASPAPTSMSARGSILLFGAAMFISAALVFALEPMIAKMILPQLGGSPAVWNTSMMFFQAALLAGYAYAHGLQRLLPVRAQIVTHLTILAVSALVLPVSVSKFLGPPPVDNPVWWLLGVLTVSIGAPFAALSSTAPLLQAWYVHLHSNSAQKENPYVLYGASNLGSMLALLAYPLFIEPTWILSSQSLIWTIQYLFFFVLAAGIGIIVWRAGDNAIRPESQAPARRTEWRRKLRWVLLAAAPSSLMLGTASFIANDIASVPLFWIIPLALYLLTFVISFQNRPIISSGTALRWQMLFAVLAASLLCVPAIILPLNLLVFLGALFFGALICHQALAADRPHESNLTEFYLLISIGGVLGGVFNALLAPMLFRIVLEFPLVLTLICLARPWAVGEITRTDILSTCAGLIAVTAIAFIPERGFPHAMMVITALAIVAGLAAALASRRTLLFTLVIGTLCFQAAIVAPDKNSPLVTIRSFFGVSRAVILTDRQLGGEVHVLFHGTTIHGSQAMAPDRRCIPGMYYASGTPLREAIVAMQRKKPALRIAVVGLGTGTIATFTRAADQMRYFEIDPAVARIASDPNYFTYLSQCARGKVDIVLGDARLTLAREPAGKFDAVILDAFSGDNIPTHLLTREAFALYFHVLKPDGIALLHIANRNLALEAPTAATAKAAGVSARIMAFRSPKEVSDLVAASSRVVLLSKSPATIAAVAGNSSWHIPDDRGVRPWTDEYTNIAGALFDHVVRHLP